MPFHGLSGPCYSASRVRILTVAMESDNDWSWSAFYRSNANTCAIDLAGMATRSYLYIDDVVEAFDIILHKGAVGETYNIGSQKERTVLSAARDILRMFQLPESQIVHVRDRAFNDRRYFVCDKKLAQLGACHQLLDTSLHRYVILLR